MADFPRLIIKSPERSLMKKRKDGRYVETITLDGGKRKFIYGTSMAEVRRKIREYNGEVAQGPTFAAAAKEWWLKKSEKIARNSLRNYEPAYERAVEAFGDYRVKEITPKMITDYIERFSHNRSAKTVSTQLNIIAQICRDSGVYPNPAAGLRIPSGLKHTPRELPSEEELQIVNDSIHCTGGLFAYFLYYSGCRRGEALALQYKDIDRAKGVIHITKSLSSYGNVAEIKTTKTQAGRRDVVLLDNLAAVLPKGKPDDYIFTWNGELITDGKYDWMWKCYCKETGLNISAHRLRHGFATLLHDAGVDPLDASRMMGHTTKQMTELYTHISASRMTGTREKLNDFVNGNLKAKKSSQKPRKA